MSDSKRLKIFVSSPGDVAEERALTERVIRRLTAQFRDQVQISTVFWEHEPLFAHTGFQQQIARPSECDLVITILWSRLGTRLPASFALTLGEQPPTGTEFEIRDAMQSLARSGRPRLLIYQRMPGPVFRAEEARDRLAQYESLQQFIQRNFYDAQGASVVAHHTYATPPEYERKLSEHLRKWIEREGASRPQARWRTGSPFRGLQVFESEHREIFFGRAQAISDVLRQIREAESRLGAVRFLSVRGMSGVGKSSLVRAGVLPLLEGRAVEGVGAWKHVILKPSERGEAVDGVFGALSEQLLAAIPELQEGYTAERLAERLREAPAEAAARLDGYLTHRARTLGLEDVARIRLLVCVDQLEECWTALSAADRARLAMCLTALCGEGRVWVVATIRSDFIEHMESSTEFGALVRQGRIYALLPPRADELMEIIRGPAEAAALLWESKDGVSLDQEILREASDNREGLPLLEYALDQLYQRRTPEGMLTYDAYEALGRLGGGVAATAEAILKELGPTAERALPTVLRALVRVDEIGTATRRYMSLDRVEVGTPEHTLILKLISYRLIVTDSRPKGAVAYLAHEALLRSWPRLADWLRGESRLLMDREIVERDARLWHEQGRKAGWLGVTPEKREQQKRVVDSGLVLEEQTGEFVRRSAALFQTRRLLLRGTVAAIVVLAATLGIAAALAWQQRNQARAAIGSQLVSSGWRNLESGDFPRAARYALAARPYVRDEESLRPLLGQLVTRLPDEGGWALGNLGAGEIDSTQDASRIVVRKFADEMKNVVEIWGVARSAMLARIPHPDEVYSASFSPDDQLVVTSCLDGIARVWDGHRGTLLFTLDNDGPIGDAFFSDDGTKIVVTEFDSVAIWDKESRRKIASLQHGRQLFTVNCSRDASVCASTAIDKSAVIWNTKAQSVIDRATVGYVDVPVVVSPDGNKALVSGDSKSVLIMNLADSVPPVELPKQEVSLTKVSWSDEGSQFVTVDLDHFVRLWDATSGEFVSRFEHSDRVTSALVSADGKLVLTSSADRTARVWDAVTAQELFRIHDALPLRSAAWFGNATGVVTVSEEGDIRVWKLSKHWPPIVLKHEDGVQRVAISTDGRWAATASFDDSARVWEVKTGRLIMKADHEDSVVDVAFSGDGRQLLTASEDHTARMWDIASGKETGRVTHDAPLKRAIFGPSGRIVMTAAEDGSIAVVETETFSEKRRIQSSGGAEDIAVSRDESLLAVALGGDAELWNLRRDQEPVSLSDDGDVLRVQFSPDGQKLLTAGDVKAARMWDVATGRELHSFDHGILVFDARFSADGTRVVTAADDGTARVWDWANGREVARFNHGANSWVLNASFSPDDRWILTSASDGTSRVWDISSGREASRAWTHWWVDDDTHAVAQMSPRGDLGIAAVWTDGNATVWNLWPLKAPISEIVARLCGSPVLSPRKFNDGDLLADPSISVIDPTGSMVAKACGGQ